MVAADRRQTSLAAAPLAPNGKMLAQRAELLESALKLMFDPSAGASDVYRPATARQRQIMVLSWLQPREALDAAKAMVERGVRDVEILDKDGIAHDLAELERAAEEHEAG